MEVFMKGEIAERIREIALELTSVLSVVNTSGEVDVSEKVYEIFAQMDYYIKNPEDLKFVSVKNDKLGRKSVLATVRGQKNKSNKTVALIGHIDTVGISDYGNLKEYAHKPLELTEKMKSLHLPQEVLDDLESGNYLFGRGIFDMKSGVAVLMGLIESITNNIEEFEGNLVFAAVCDEEGNSGGMLNVIPELVRLKEEDGFDFQALLDTDYITSEHSEDENKYVYIGTVGKLMPSFFVVGKETHVGESFKGIDPNQIVSEITKRINLNTEFCDVAEGEASLPPVTLRQRDLKTEYSVQIANKSFVMFNYATHISTPDQVLKKMVDVAKDSFQLTIDNLNNHYKDYCQLVSRPHEKLSWKANVITYGELYKEVEKEVIDLDIKVKDFIEIVSMDEAIDLVDKTTMLVDYVHSFWSNRNPVVIVYFTPPYYPHIYVEGKSEKDKNLLNAVSHAVDTTKTDYNLIYKKFFPYISDLSYGAAPKDKRIINNLKENLPGFGFTYDLPLEEMQKLNLPVLDIGCFGKDAHKFTERVETKYSYEVVPELVYKTVNNLLRC